MSNGYGSYPPPGGPGGPGGYPPHGAPPPHGPAQGPYGSPQNPYSAAPGPYGAPPGQGGWGAPPSNSSKGSLIALLVVVAIGIIVVLTLWLTGSFSSPRSDVNVAVPSGGTYGSSNGSYGTSASGSIDQAFISGRWCDDSGGAVTFTPMGSSPTIGNARMVNARGQISSERYELIGSSIAIDNPTRGRTVLPLARVDASTMTITPTGRGPETMRRC